MKQQCLAFVLACAAANLGCGVLTGDSDDGLRVATIGESLRLRNDTMGRVHYLIVEEEAAALIDWAPCTGDGCPTLRARSSVVLPYGEIIGYTPAARRAIVYWWPSTSLERLGRDPDLIEQIVVAL